MGQASEPVDSTPGAAEGAAVVDAGPPSRSQGGALTSIRFRLATLWSVVLFGLATSTMVLVYLGVVNGLEAESLAANRDLPDIVDDDGGVELAVRAELGQLEDDAATQATDEMRRSFFMVLGGMFLVSIAIGWTVAGQLLKPINQITSVATEIQAGDLSRRIALKGPDDELRRLADTFDSMLGRLQTAFDAQQAFVQEASHELRNPLAVMRTNLDVALSDPDADATELRHTAEVVRRAAERMSSVVDGLVVLGRKEVPEMQAGDVDLTQVAREEVEEFEIPALHRSVRLWVNATGPVQVRGDAQAIRQVVANLIDNAVRLAPEGTSVVVSTAHAGDRAVLAVTDAGPGIAPEDRAKVFQRFWKGQARGPEERPRTGLGLAIVRQIAEAHGGEVELESEVGLGTTFRVIFPTGSAQR